MLILDQVHRRAGLHHYQNLRRRIGGSKKQQRPLHCAIEHAKIPALQTALEFAAAGQHAHTDLYHLGGHLQRLLRTFSSLLCHPSEWNHGETENGGERSAEEQQTQRMRFSKVANQSERRRALLATATRARHNVARAQVSADKAIE
jgi:hypothetical protein